MPKPIIAGRKSGSLYLLALLLCAGCATGGFQKPVASFQQNIERSSGIISQYYYDLNKFERQIYLDECFFDIKRKVEMRNAQGKLTPLSGSVFSPAGIKARLESLDLLALYASRLAALAGSKAPARLEMASQALGENLTNLAKTFADLAKAGDTSAGQYIGPVGTLAGLVGRMFMEAYQEAALTQAVKDGAPVVNNILDILEKDMGRMVKPLQETGAAQMLYSRVADYNKKRKKLSDAERRQALDKINLAAQAYQSAIAADPASLVQGIRRAHNALVAYAVSDRQPKDLTALAAAMEAFAIRVEQIAQALKQFPRS